MRELVLGGVRVVEFYQEGVDRYYLESEGTRIFVYSDPPISVWSLRRDEVSSAVRFLMAKSCNALLLSEGREIILSEKHLKLIARGELKHELPAEAAHPLAIALINYFEGEGDASDR